MPHVIAWDIPFVGDRFALARILPIRVLRILADSLGPFRGRD